MVVFYYTSVAYLDIAIEVVNALKHVVKLHVVIEIAPESKGTNILNVGSLAGLPTLAAPEMVLDHRAWDVLHPYFDGTASVSFFVQQNRRTFSLDSLKECRRLSRFIASVEPDIIHFDTAKARALGLLPFLYARYRKKVFITIHDPLPHSGEFNWRNILVKKGFFPLSAGFIFYSAFSESLFRSAFPAYRKKTGTISMHPYSFYRHYLPDPPVERDAILFFGRISPYKGVDIFLKAIPIVLAKYPQERFIIAGAKGASYELDKTLIDACGSQLTLMLRHIQNDELMELVARSKMVVCPYRDATQSGVLMTAYAANTGVVASRVGAFPEYVEPARNGLLFEAGDADALAAAIIEALEQQAYSQWSRNLSANGHSTGWKSEAGKLVNIYHSALKK